MLNNALLLDMQLSTPLSANNDYVSEQVNEVIKLLDDYTLDAAETQILTIVGDLTPSEFYLFLELLSRRTYQTRTLLNRYDVNDDQEMFYLGVKDSSRSYIKKLYDDLNGTEFTAFNHIMKSKLLAYKAGDISRMEQILTDISDGRCIPDIEHYEAYTPFELTSIDSWANGNQPGFCRFQPNGDLVIAWERRLHWYTVSGHNIHALKMRPTDLIAVEHTEIPGKYEFCTVLEVKDMVDKGDRGTIFNALNIVGVVCGGFAVGAAKGLLKKAFIALIQVALPSAGQYVQDHDEQILQMKHGSKVVNGFALFSMVTAAYGISRVVLTPIGAAMVNKLRQSVDDFVNANRVDDIVTGVASEFVKIERAMDDILSHINQLGIRSGEKGWFQRTWEKLRPGSGGRAPNVSPRSKPPKLTEIQLKLADDPNTAAQVFDELIRPTKMFRKFMGGTAHDGVFYRGIKMEEIRRIEQNGGMLPKCFTPEGKIPFSQALEMYGVDWVVMNYVGGHTQYLTALTESLDIARINSVGGVITRVTLNSKIGYKTVKFSEFGEEIEFLVPGIIDISKIERYIPETDRWEPLVNFLARQ